MRKQQRSPQIKGVHQARKRRLARVTAQDPMGLDEAPDPQALRGSVDNQAIASPANILALQRSYGNQAVQRLLGGHQPDQDERVHEPLSMPARSKPWGSDVANPNGLAVKRYPGPAVGVLPARAQGIVQRRGTYDPINIVQAGNNAPVEEEEWGVGDVVSTTAITSCLVVFGKIGQQVKCVHLAVIDGAGAYPWSDYAIAGQDDDERFTEVVGIVASILADCTEFVMAGALGFWPDACKSRLRAALGPWLADVNQDSGAVTGRVGANGHLQVT